MTKKTDVIVVGAGAAGLMCAIEAGRRGRTVTVLDHSAVPGRKIAISGGGRCNFTNIHAGPENYLSQNPGFCKSALARYTPRDFIARVEEHRIRYHEKERGQLFCDGSSREIIEMLLDECRAVRVKIRTGCRVDTVQKGIDFRIATPEETLACDSLVIATGGLSFPRLGATDFGHRIAKQFGLKLISTRPALVPLTYPPGGMKRFRDLSGISMSAVARHGGRAFAGEILLTHRGLSGPAILQISSYWSEGGTVEIDLAPDLDAGAWLVENHGQTADLATVLSRRLPRRFAEAWCEEYTPSKRMSLYKAGQLREIGRALNHWMPQVHSTEGYSKAEVTLGGVDTAGLSSKTMEARAVPGLYFIGEVVDVTGWLGGFNFQWAWASGHAAGLAA